MKDRSWVQDSLDEFFFVTNFLFKGDDLQYELLERFISQRFLRQNVVLWLAPAIVSHQVTSGKALDFSSQFWKVGGTVLFLNFSKQTN